MNIVFAFVFKLFTEKNNQNPAIRNRIEIILIRIHEFINLFGLNSNKESIWQQEKYLNLCCL